MTEVQKSDETMLAPDLLVRVSSMIHALKCVETRVKEQILTEAVKSRGKSFYTDMGTVNIVIPQDSIELVDEQALAATLPVHQTMLVLRDGVKRTILERLRVTDDGDVMDPATGEIVTWARVRPGGAPYVSWPRSKEQTAAKERAVDQLGSLMGDLAPRLAALTVDEATG